MNFLRKIHNGQNVWQQKKINEIKKMAKKSIFISYDYDNDRAYKNLLLAWDKNSDFDFGFNDQSADVSIDSTDASVIKRAISAKINSASYFLCLVGKYTKNSSWVKWEINKAVELNKRIR